MQSGVQLRLLFVTILIHGSPSNPRQLCTEFHTDLSDDCNRRLRMSGVQQPTQEQVHCLALNEIAQLLQASDKSLDSFDLPQPTIPMNDLQSNRFILEQLSGHIEVLREEVARDIVTLNVEQLQIYEKVMRSTTQDPSDHIYFVDGPCGTGKTYLENVLLKSLRSQNQIALAVAGIAAQLLQKGRTAHSRFKIPIDLHCTSVCNIYVQSYLAEMIRQTKQLIWDEAPMTHKYAFEAVDRTLRDITKHDKPFGGITVVMCGDFRQVLPVVKKGVWPGLSMYQRIPSMEHSSILCTTPKHTCRGCNTYSTHRFREPPGR